jgi:hypothetical protein
VEIETSNLYSVERMQAPRRWETGTLGVDREQAKRGAHRSEVLRNKSESRVNSRKKTHVDYFPCIKLHTRHFMSAISLITHNIPKIDYQPHFTERKTEAQSCEVSWSRLHKYSW